MGKLKRFTLIGLVSLLAEFVLLYIVVIRPWHMRWGATDQELAMALPGDAIAARDAETSTRAITIHAPA